MRTGVLAVIPARLGSSRFARKVLYEHEGKPLLYYVWRRVCRSKQVDRVVVATDSQQIATVVQSFGGEFVFTSKRHKTGSDRVAEAASKLGAGMVVNVQGDTVGLDPRQLDRLIGSARESKGKLQADCFSLARPIASVSELTDTNVVKVVVGANGQARWFSRLPIPYLQHSSKQQTIQRHRFLAHIGIYLFSRKSLEQFASWKRTPCEKAESLEQLRILENNRTIRVLLTRKGITSIDRPEDLKKVSDKI